MTAAHRAHPRGQWSASQVMCVVVATSRMAYCAVLLVGCLAIGVIAALAINRFVLRSAESTVASQRGYVAMESDM